MTPLGGSDPEGALGPQALAFLQAAGVVLGDVYDRRLKKLPWQVCDTAYDHALKTITSRAQRGVSGFCDDRGRLIPERIKAYVKFVVECKVKGSWQGERTAQLHDRLAADEDDDVFALAARLARDQAADDMLASAQAELEHFERRVREIDEERLSSVVAQLAEHGVGGVRTELVMLRAGREFAIVLGVGRLEVRFRAAMGLAEIARRLGISYVYARKLNSTTRAMLPPMALPLIDNPLAYQLRFHDVGPSADGGPES